MLGGGGIAGAIVVILGLIFGVDLGKFQAAGAASRFSKARPAGDPEEDKLAHFAKVVFRDTEIVWDKQFAKMGKRYTKPTLHLFRNEVNTACGPADAGVGPFYCPGIPRSTSTGLLRSAREATEVEGEFARAYVLATRSGTTSSGCSGTRQGGPGPAVRAQGRREPRIRPARTASRLPGRRLGHYANEEFKGMLEPGDIESAMNAASNIGDDTLQRKSGRSPVPDSFTHGTSPSGSGGSWTGSRPATWTGQDSCSR